MSIYQVVWATCNQRWKIFQGDIIIQGKSFIDHLLGGAISRLIGLDRDMIPILEELGRIVAFTLKIVAIEGYKGMGEAGPRVNTSLTTQSP